MGFSPHRGRQMEGRAARLLARARPRAGAKVPSAGAKELLDGAQGAPTHGVVQARPPVLVWDPEQGPEVLGRGRCEEPADRLALPVHARQRERAAVISVKAQDVRVCAQQEVQALEVAASGGHMQSSLAGARLHGPVHVSAGGDAGSQLFEHGGLHTCLVEFASTCSASSYQITCGRTRKHFQHRAQKIHVISCIHGVAQYS